MRLVRCQLLCKQHKSCSSAEQVFLYCFIVICFIYYLLELQTTSTRVDCLKCGKKNTFRMCLVLIMIWRGVANAQKKRDWLLDVCAFKNRCIYIYYKYIKQLKYWDSLGHAEKSCKTSLWFSMVTRTKRSICICLVKPYLQSMNK